MNMYDKLQQEYDNQLPDEDLEFDCEYCEDDPDIECQKCNIELDQNLGDYYED